jgi:thymidine phosphorylase
MMVMSKKHAIEHLRKGTTIEKFKEVLVERHGEEVLEDY